MPLLAQAGDSVPSWFSGIVAGGACAILLAFIIWRLFGHLIPEFLKTLKEERDAFRLSLDGERKDYKEALLSERLANREILATERALHHQDMDKITRAIQEQNILLVQLVNQKASTHHTIDANLKQVE